MKRSVFLILTVQSLVLVTMIAVKQCTLETGTPVLLETVPIDPRSLFRGDYVRLNYAVSRLKLDELAGDSDFHRHDPIYVRLTRGDKYWEPLSLHREKPEAEAEQVVIKGEVKSISDRWWNPESQKSEELKTINVRYGIENYFVPEGEGRKLERPTEGELVDIRVVVDSFGNAAIKAVLVNGIERYVERLF